VTPRPERLKDSPESDDFARGLLAAGRPTAGLPPAARFRGERRVTKLAAIPVVVLGVGLWSKVVAAAFGIGFASALALVSVAPSLKQRLVHAPESIGREEGARAALPARAAPREVEPQREAEPPRTVAPAPLVVTSPLAPSRMPIVERTQPAASVARANAPDTAEPGTLAPEALSLSDLGVHLDTPGSASAAVAPEKPPTEDSMPAEVRLLSHARILVGTDPQQALQLLEQHAALFPNASLALEREVLVIEALQRAGRVAEAKARAKRLLAGSPGAIYTARLERIIGEPR
jgi:hypothetical protein